MRETSVQFGRSQSLVGTICLAEEQSADVGLLLLNAGIVSRVGPHRVNVRLARRAAQLGFSSIRFDLSGQGDSSSVVDASSYRQQASIDISAAMDTLSHHANVSRFALFGICSGADNGYTAALEDPRIVSVMMYDPIVFPTFRWRAKAAWSKFAKYGLIGSWKRFRAIRMAGNDAGGDFDSLNAGRPLPHLENYCNQLRQLVQRGVSVRLVYSGSTVDQSEFDHQKNTIIKKVDGGDRLNFEVLPEADHVFSSYDSQQTLMSRFERWLA